MTSGAAEGAPGFRRAEPPAAGAVQLTIDGAPVEAAPGDTVAAVLLLRGRTAYRVNRATGENRGPFCMMGVCFECLVAIDGVPGRRACMTGVREGMRVETRTGAP